MVEFLFYIVVSVIATILIFQLMGVMTELYWVLKAIHIILNFVIEGVEDDEED
jgi:hypothetical protein